MSQKKSKNASNTERDELIVQQEQHKELATGLMALMFRDIMDGTLSMSGLIREGRVKKSDDRYVYQVRASGKKTEGLLTLMFSFKQASDIVTLG